MVRAALQDVREKAGKPGQLAGENWVTRRCPGDSTLTPPGGELSVRGGGGQPENSVAGCPVGPPSVHEDTRLRGGHDDDDDDDADADDDDGRGSEWQSRDLRGVGIPSRDLF